MKGGVVMDLTAFTAAITSIKADVISAFDVVAPLALAVLGLFLVWRYGTRIFKGLSK